MVKKLNKTFLLKMNWGELLPLIAVAAIISLKAISYYNIYLGWNVNFYGDEAIYALLAQRLINGDALHFFNPYWNSGMPFFSIFFFFFTKSMEHAQILLSMTSHLLLIITVYLTLKSFSKVFALVSAFLVTFSPSMTKLITYWGITEPLYILFYWLAIYFGWQSLSKNINKYYILSGIFFGLAYFTRTEVIYTLFGFLILIFIKTFFQLRQKIFWPLQILPRFKLANIFFWLSVLISFISYIYVPVSRMVGQYPIWKATKFDKYYFTVPGSSVFLVCLFLTLATLTTLLQIKRVPFLQNLKEHGLKVMVCLVFFIIINVPYITAISIELGKLTLSGKYAYIGSAHAFTPEKDRLATWAQDIWSIDFPNFRSSYYNSTRAMQTLWAYRDHSLEALKGKFLYNMNAYSFDNVYSYLDDGIVILGLITSLFLLRFRPFISYLLYIWLFSFLWIAYSMENTYRYLAYSFPIFLTFESLAVANIVQLLSKLISHFRFPSKANMFISIIIPTVFLFFYAQQNHSLEGIFKEAKTYRYADQKMIGQWLKSHNITLFMGRTEALGFYSGAQIVYIPAATPEYIIKYAKAWGVEYIVSRPVESSWDYMKAIVDPNFTHPDLVKIYRFNDGTIIWKVSLTEDEKKINKRTNQGV